MRLVLLAASAGCYLLSFGRALVRLRGGKEYGRSADIFFWGGLAGHSLLLAALMLGAWLHKSPQSIGLSSSMLLISWGAVAFFAFCQWREPLAPAGQLFLPLPLLMLVAAARIVDQPAAATAVAAPGSHLFFLVHIAALLVGCGVLFSTMAVSLFYLLKQRILRRRPVSDRHLLFPSLDSLERAGGWGLYGGFGLWAVGVVSGLMLAHRRWPGNWSADPVVLFSILAVLWYGILILVRWLLGWRGWRGVTLMLAGFLLLVFILVGMVFFFPKGKHPYLELSLSTTYYNNLSRYYINI